MGIRPPHVSACQIWSALQVGWRLDAGLHQLDDRLPAGRPAHGRSGAPPHAHSGALLEQPVNLDDGDDVFDWPWLYGVEVGHWDLTDAQTQKLRDYLLRGGFFMVDDFHGTQEWAIFMASIQRVFPDRPIVEIPDKDPIFHTLWDMDTRFQVPGLQFVYTHRTYENDGVEPHWRGIYDDRGRIMVAICFNMDLGDSVEHSDNPSYPQEYSAQGMRTFLDYVIYAMTH